MRRHTDHPDQDTFDSFRDDSADDDEEDDDDEDRPPIEEVIDVGMMDGSGDPVPLDDE